MQPNLRIWLGWDSREPQAYKVAVRSLRAHNSRGLEIRPIDRERLAANGWYHRPTERRDGRLFDVFSDAPMSTDHAIARFWVPQLSEFTGWALFADGDILCRADIADLFALANDRYAVMCVQHDFTATETRKMDAQIQLAYPRKLWSSVVLWNCEHPAHRTLTLENLNTVPGRYLHAFTWLKDDDIGALPPAWNYCVGVSPHIEDPSLVHFTLGLPDMPGYEHCEFADEWRGFLREAVA